MPLPRLGSDNALPSLAASVISKLIFHEQGAIRAELKLSIKTRTPAGMAGAAIAADLDAKQDDILIAVRPDLLDGLDLAGRVALAPKASPRA